MPGSRVLVVTTFDLDEYVFPALRAGAAGFLLKGRPSADLLTAAGASREVLTKLLRDEWPPGEPEPTDYWLATLPVDTKLRDLVRPAKIRWRIEHDHRELKDGPGLDHFEGRSWIGRHRHVTLAAVAPAICTQLRRTPKAPPQA